jgi:hypothetical protein
MEYKDTRRQTFIQLLLQGGQVLQGKQVKMPNYARAASEVLDYLLLRHSFFFWRQKRVQLHILNYFWRTRLCCGSTKRSAQLRNRSTALFFYLF